MLPPLLDERANTTGQRRRELWYAPHPARGRQRRALQVRRCLPGLLSWVFASWKADRLALG
ncbi:MAG: hypothetical protein ABIK62_06340, partial [candidate division WOR-3 bacterium]